MMGRPISLDSVGNRRILAALTQRGPMTLDDLAIAACLSRRTLDGNPWYIRALEAAGRIYVERWIRATELERPGRAVAVYAAGAGPSKPPPTPLTDRQRARRWRQTPKYDAYLARKAFRERGIGAADPILAAMTSTTGRPELAR